MGARLAGLRPTNPNGVHAWYRSRSRRTGTVPPASTPSPSSTTASASALAMAASWWDPWPPDERTRRVPSGATRASTRTKCVLPSGRRGSGSSATAAIRARCQRSSGCPASRRRAGRASNSKLTSDDTGLPGSPNTGTRRGPRSSRPAGPGTTPKASGLAGRIATCIHRMSPIRSRTTLTRSVSPIDTPPLDRTASHDATPRWRASAMAAAASGARPRSTGSNPAPPPSPRLAGPEVVAGAPDVVPRLRGVADLHPVGPAGQGAVATFGPLDHDHGVGTLRDRGAGEDAHCLARSERAGGRVPGGDLGNDRKDDRRLGRPGGIDRPQGVAVHGRVGERRDVPGGGDDAGEHAPTRLGHGHRARGERRAPRQDVRNGPVERD